MAVEGKPHDEQEQEVLREERDFLRRQFALVAGLSRRLAGSLDPAVLLREVVDAACELTGARYGALGVFGADGRIVEFVTHGISEERRAAIGDLPQGRGLLGLLQREQRAVRVSDIAQHPESVGFPPNHPPMASFIGVPIRREAEALGNLYLTEKPEGAPFTDEDEALLQLLAEQAALAIYNARLHEEAEGERVRLRTLLETSPVGVLVLRRGDPEVRLVNREGARLLGVPVEEGGPALQAFEGGGSYRKADGVAYEPDELPIRRALERGERVAAEEFRIELPDGTTVPTLVNATPVFEADGSISGAIAVFQDISPIEELERLRNDFLGMVSHELKTPLTAIKGAAAMALGPRGALSGEEVTQLFEIIDEQSDRLRDLVDNLLDVTRIEAGMLSITQEAVELRRLVDEAVGTLTRVNGRRDVRVQVPDDLPFVAADSRRVGQVLHNLLSNAAKFSPADSPVEVSAEAGTSHVTVRVQDRGRGFSADQAALLFKKFSQLPDEYGRARSGQGLGLAVCKGIVEAHGGRIWAESPGAGLGSTFTFTLPVAVDPVQREGVTVDVTQRSAHLGRISRPGERTRVLVIDDEPPVLRYVQRTLDDAGFRAVVTPDPDEGVRLAASEEPDIVLLDMHLPGTDGFEVLRRLREFSGVPLMFLTAQSDSEVAARALRAGADDYVTKPFSASELLARIEAALRRRLLSDQTEVRAPYALGDLVVDFADRRVTVADRAVALSATEYKLLFALATNAGRVLTHDQILHDVWGPEYSGEHELVRSFIRNLRRKLGDDARSPRYILTEPQVGYRMPRPQT